MRLRAAATSTVLALALAGCSSSTRAASAPSIAAAPPPATGAPTTPLAPTTAPPTTAAPTTPAPTTAAPTTAAPTAPAQSPPLPVAASTLAIVDPSRPTVAHGHQVATSRTLTTLVWRPAEPGRWPLVVFAHGYQVGPTPYTTLLEAWAAAGYVVVAPEFPLTDAAVAGADLDELDIDNQPADVRFVLDTVVGPGSPIAADVDPSKVVIAGHSDGGETALAVGNAPTPPGEPALAGVLAMSAQALPGVATMANPPILVTQGDADDINPPSLGEGAYASARSPRWYLDIVGGGHLPPLEAHSRWLPAIEATTEAFFAYVTDRGTEAAFTAAANHPGITRLSAG